MKPCVTLLLAGALFLSGCASSNPGTESDEPRDEPSVDDFLGRIESCVAPVNGLASGRDDSERENASPCSCSDEQTGLLDLNPSNAYAFAVALDEGSAPRREHYVLVLDEAEATRAILVLYELVDQAGMLVAGPRVRTLGLALSGRTNIDELGTEFHLTATNVEASASGSADAGTTLTIQTQPQQSERGVGGGQVRPVFSCELPGFTLSS